MLKVLVNGSKELWLMLYWDSSGFSKEEENTELSEMVTQPVHRVCQWLPRSPLVLPSMNLLFPFSNDPQPVRNTPTACLSLGLPSLVLGDNSLLDATAQLAGHVLHPVVCHLLLLMFPVLLGMSPKDWWMVSRRTA